jgi:hypothetical protein
MLHCTVFICSHSIKCFTCQGFLSVRKWRKSGSHVWWIRGLSHIYDTVFN